MQIDFEQSISSPHFSIDTLMGRSKTGVMPALLIKYHKHHSAKNAIMSYVQEIKLILSAHVNIAKYMYALFKYKIHPIRLKSLYVKRNTKKKGLPK